MLSEIGSNFWINPAEVFGDLTLITPELFNVDGNDYSWFSTGRSAISFVLEEIEERNPSIKKVAVIPPYTCHTVIEPFLKHGYVVKTYPVDEGLRTTGNSMLSVVEYTGAGVLLIHRYFGFDTLLNCKKQFEEIQKMGVEIIEDKTQCLYSHVNDLKADFTVGSIRKWLGVPDGGFAVCAKGEFTNKPQKSDMCLEKVKLEASIQKYKYLFNGEGKKQEFLDKFSVAEELLDSQTQKYLIGDLSLKIQAAVNIDELKRKRRANYIQLQNGLNKVINLRPVFSELPDGVTPLYYPIIVDDRKKLQEYLADNAIYAPIVWPKSETLSSVCKIADYFYNHLLCIPIDQRYNRSDMERVIDIILFSTKHNNYFGGVI